VPADIIGVALRPGAKKGFAQSKESCMRSAPPTASAFLRTAVLALPIVHAASTAFGAGATRPAVGQVMAAFAVGAAAPSQSESELRQQNQRLEQRVRQLEAELAAALERIHELERAAKAAPAADPTTLRDPTAPAEATPTRMPLPTDGTTPAPADAPANAPSAAPSPPAATPRAAANPFEDSVTVLEAIRARFAADFAGRPAPQAGVQDDRLMRLWMTEAERWANSINREFRRQILWNVRVLGAETLGRSWRMQVISVDPETRGDIGSPFEIHLQQTQATAYERSIRLGTAGEDFTLRGTYIPQVVLNPTRFDVGLFDNPPFVGTFLEYGFRISVTSLMPADARRRPATAPGATPAQGAPPSTPMAPPSTPPAGAPSPAPGGP